MILQPIGLTLAKAVKVCRCMAHKAVKQSIKQHLTPPAHSRIIHPVITTAGQQIQIRRLQIPAFHQQLWVNIHPIACKAAGALVR